jgi:hypoxanthine phosphoribosyltransferase
VAELGNELSRDYLGKAPILVGILKGSALFLSDLIRRMNIDCEIDFISISSYGNRTRSSGSVQLLKDLDRDIYERDVIVVEDIVDSGNSLSYIRKSLLARSPRSFAIVALLDKKERRETPVYVDYVGFEIEDRFVVGYGLDYAERYRGLPHIAVLDDDDLREGEPDASAAGGGGSTFPGEFGGGDGSGAH